MVRAGLITRDSAVHLAAPSRREGERGTLCGRVRAPGGQPGRWIRLQARVSCPTLHRLGMAVKQEGKITCSNWLAKSSRRKEGLGVRQTWAWNPNFISCNDPSRGFLAHPLRARQCATCQLGLSLPICELGVQKVRISSLLEPGSGLQAQSRPFLT